MKIKLLKELRLALDGVHVQAYAAGAVLECPEVLAHSLMKEGLVEPAGKETKMLRPKRETKVLPQAAGKGRS